MAEVWEGYDETLSRPVAVKVLKAHLAADDSFRERFRREAITAAGLVHPNVVAIFDSGLDAGTAYIVMELVRGRTLRDLMAERGPLPPALAIVITDQIAEALAQAHRGGLVHRDIKPANVLLCDDDTASPRVKVTDFGIAKATEHLDLDLTQTGMLIGTPKYVSPEQVDGRELDARTDLYALGVVLFEMLTGRAPFTGQTDVAVAMAHLQQPPPLVSTLRPGIAPGLDDLVATLLAKDPERRVASAMALRQRLAKPAVVGTANGRDPTMFDGGRSTNGGEAPRSVPPTPVAYADGRPPPAPVVRDRVLRPPVIAGEVGALRTGAPPTGAQPAGSQPIGPRSPTGDTRTNPTDRTATRHAVEPSPTLVPTSRTTNGTRPGVAADRAARLRRRHRAPGIVVGVLVLAGAVTGAVLLRTQHGGSLVPHLPAALVPSQSLTVADVSVYMVNDRPPDNAADAHYVIDGNGTTAQSWKTDVYGNAHFGNLYPGIGLALHLSSGQKLSQLTVHSPSQGWSAETFVAASAPASGTPVTAWGTPTATKSNISGNATFPLGGRSGGWILLWLTSIGGPPFQTVISGVAVR